MRRVRFSENIASDCVTSWGISVPLLRVALFAPKPEERARIIREKICKHIDGVVEAIENEVNSEVKELTISLASAWIRYYVFKLEALTNSGKFNFALNLLSPNSPITSFKNHWRNAIDVYKKFPNNVAKPIMVEDELMLQEWVRGKPLSDFKEGDIFIDEEGAKKCIPLTSKILYKLNKAGYIYKPWDDYELMLRDNEVVFLDVTRFVRKKIRDEDFLDFYFGVPFTSPDIIKLSRYPRDPSFSLYWRGVSEKDYLGASRDEYIKLFMEGVESARSAQEFR